MNSVRTMHGIGDGLAAVFRSLVRGRRLNRGAAWGLMIIGALLAFEIFNFSTTEFALHDVLGDLSFAGLSWATVLAIAFCGIDFAGIARLFTPQQGRDEPAEVWYLFGAWLLAAGFNATLTWWGVSVAIAQRSGSVSSAVIGSHALTSVVPVFVAVMVWLIRVLIIGSFSAAGDRLFSMASDSSQGRRSFQSPNLRSPSPQGASFRSASATSGAPVSGFRSAPKIPTQAAFDQAEPIYQSVSMDAVSRGQSRDLREPRERSEHRIH
jgi:hypothetical protein